jgi:hypothetical protein
MAAPDNPSELPVSVREFLVREIDSIAQLEALLLIRGEPETRWNAETLARRLYMETSAAATVIDALVARRLLQETDGAATYAAHGDRDALVQSVANSYSRFLIPMTRVIHAKVRSGAQQFADAFRLRDKKP